MREEVEMNDAAPAVLESADIVKLLTLLPHRYPFLLVDRIIDIKGDESAIGIKNVTFNEPQFTGHFPQQPVMPGVLLVEAMAQTAGAICVLATEGETKPKLVYFMTIDDCKFRKPVVPGDQVRLHLTKLKSRRNMWWYRGEALVDGALVAEAVLSAMLVNE
jgi:3-hydroxyacyl-[acyl-carrier-protein] dehydratase